MLTTDPTHAPTRRLILASQSPRRQELLQVLGWPFDVIPSNVDESATPADLPPAALARWLAEQKALDVARQHPGAVVIGADTIVVLGDEVMGKPTDDRDAARMLRTLSGAAHRVITGIAVRREGPERLQLSDAVETEVTFRPLTDHEIEAYVRTGEPMDKAGAYAIQGGAMPFVTRIDGDPSNVIGLPLWTVAEMLTAFGVELWRPRAAHVG